MHCDATELVTDPYASNRCVGTDEMQFFNQCLRDHQPIERIPMVKGHCGQPLRVADFDGQCRDVVAAHAGVPENRSKDPLSQTHFQLPVWPAAELRIIQNEPQERVRIQQRSQAT